MKFILAVAAGAAAAKFLSPMVLDALKIEPRAGFGVDDMVEIALVAAGAYTVRAVLR